ncbi:MAG: type II toxin-antitoxin system HicB family antitoxin [Planctomycetes bacterium]|nr:type II toxin-antitoxin system HicB family antitoxin [Planctomycetota bacterium]MBI3846940.1 type II toxin-antitoxin system HicB family antitoxin [Planctomycetota bacterium]
MKTKEYAFTVIIEPGEDRGYVVTCPALPGLVTEGRTLKEARAMVKEAILGYLECLRKDKRPVPRDVAPLKEKVRVAVSVA